MKFLTSSSSSASSTTTTTATSATATTFDGNDQTPRNTPGGCIAGVFRRLLCLKSLPTNPSDHIHQFKEAESRGSVSVSAKAAPPPPPPSIVARLMGIESFPDLDFSATKRSHNSVARSRSMNSVELMKELASIQGRHHRRAKSFRESPTRFVELEDEDFFILSFESGSKSRKSEVGTGQNAKKQIVNGENPKKLKSSCKRRESVYEQNKENLVAAVSVRNEPRKARGSTNVLRPTNGTSYRNHHSPAKENKNPTKMKKKKRKDDCLTVKKPETECDSQNSSPSSVLDIMKLQTNPDPEVSCSSREDVSRLTKSKSRRTLAEDLENYRKLQSSPLHRQCSNTPTSGKSRSFEGVSPGYKYMWGEMCKLAGGDIVGSRWMMKFEEYKEISGDLEVQILDEIVGEIVGEFVKV